MSTMAPGRHASPGRAAGAAGATSPAQSACDLLGGSRYHCDRLSMLRARPNPHPGDCSMARVTPILTAQQRVDPYLDYLFREWRQVPQIAREWDEWGDHEQLDFVVEWPIREDRLHQLRQWHEQGLL